jgi:N-methylhydantoinase B
MDSTGEADFFTIEVIQNALTAMGEEMFVILQRTAHSPLIFETLDFAVGATDSVGEVVCMGNGVTGFLGTLDAAVRDVIRKYGAAGTIRADDIYILNTPWEGGGSHLSDVSLIMPVFDGEALVAFVVNKAHWSEIGGMSPGSVTGKSTEIYQEGLHFPNVRLYDAGRLNEALVEMIRANVRLPDMTIGDMWAGVAALRTGEMRLRGLIGKYGRPAVQLAMRRLLDYGEAMVRAELRRLPKGSFSAVDSIDADGLGGGPFEIRCTVTITDDKFIADFTDSHPQVRGSINTTYTNLCSRVRVMFRAITTPQVPTNGGMYRPIEVICPPGTIFTAQPPAPMSTYYETAIMALDLMWKALAPAMPDRLTAGNLASVCAAMLSGRHPQTGEFWVLFGPYLGGWGAGCDMDGQRGQFCAGNGETYNIPVELTEARYGLTVERYGFRDDAGGFGTWTGGAGVVLDYRVTSEEVVFSCGYGRLYNPPWGVDGGHDGLTNHATVIRRDGSEEVYGKVSDVRVQRGELVRLVTATGGGWGAPRGRARARVLADLRDGFITPAIAREVYGVTVGAGEGGAP